MLKRWMCTAALVALTPIMMLAQAEPAQANGNTPAESATQNAAAPAAQTAAAAFPKFDSDTFAGLGARSIGPATMSGRVPAIDAVVENGRITLYVGAAAGGVWKSTDGGSTFKPVFDKYTQSIGAIAINRKDPKTVWVGTGEAWMRNTVSVGTGVYKTTDGGDDWTSVGLKDTEHIAKIELDPRSADTAYVCATGHAFNSNAERGVFKTTDGGKTWTKVLFVNEDTGCAMMSMDKSNPDTLFAGMWQFRRKPWMFNSGGPGSGLYKSTDGGKSWKKLEGNGLPAPPYGRIAVAIAPSKPSTVYAVIEAKDSALYRSDDGGDHWVRLNNGESIVGRPFYFSNLFVDPKDWSRVYKPATSLVISEDGGKTFSPIAGSVHSDFHTMWINPENPEQLFIGCDGGVYTSEDRGAHWRFLENLPLSQFYHVSYDMKYPYNVYGGLQDNNSWWGPSSGVSGVFNRDWRAVYGGDGFWAWPDPTDWDYIYAEYQGGNLGRVNRNTLETQTIFPLPGFGEKDLRENWNTPVVISPTQKGVVYFGSQYLYKTTDHGLSWQRISPDLTTNDPAKQNQENSGGLTVDNSNAEKNNTIYTIAESPKDPQMIWVGTDDGNVQLTTDDGKTWSNLTKNVGVPPATWVTTIEASPYDVNTAFATFDGHMLGDMKTYVYKTTDAGKSWQSLTTPDLNGYAQVVRQDIVDPNLLFLGTETGLFISLDGGHQWAKYTGGGFPPAPVRDIAIQPRENDLILATHGRGIWIIDNITALRKLTPEVLEQAATFVDGGPQVMKIAGQDDGTNGDTMFSGSNPPDAALITYYQKKRHIFGDLKFEVYDGDGKLVSTIPGNLRRGLNRVEWTMRMPPPKVPPAAGLVENFFSFIGPRVLPGTYTVKMIDNKTTTESKLVLVPDPRSKHSMEDRQLQHKVVMQLYNMLADLTFQVDRITDAATQANARSAKLGERDITKKRLDAFAQSVQQLRGQLVATKEGGGITGEEKLREHLGDLYGGVNEYEGRPTQSQIDRMGALQKELDKVVAEFDALSARELPGINASLQKQRQEPVKVMTKAEWDAAQGPHKD